MVIITRIIAEIIASMLYEKLRVREGGRPEGRSWWSSCLGRAMSKAVVCACLVESCLVERGARECCNAYVGWRQ
jgi:hypothetical protein